METQSSMNRLIGVVCLIVLFGLPALSSAADDHPPVELGAPLRSGMVLQREMPVPVWGWTTPGNTVTVEFAGQKKQAVAGQDGKWLLKLDPLEASDQPKGMLVFGGEGRAGLSLGDILVGEVWIASGQSNMQWLASKSDVGRVLQAGIKTRVEAGQEKAPIIREAKVTDVFSALHPIERAQIEWIDDEANMSAIAFAFAYELWRELGVPIGILNCSFSSTAIEAWTPREGFAKSKHPHTRSIHQKLLESDPSTPEHKAAWDTFYSGIEAAIADNELRIANGQPAEPINLDTPGNFKGNRDATWLYNARMHPFVPYAVRGAIWNQGYANAGGGLDYYANLHSLVRGWRFVWQRPDLPVYFHQFYSAGNVGGTPPGVSFDSVSEMRLGTAMARDIPNTGMASQIDIGGAIHYDRKALPGQRLALHALKNQYPATTLKAGGLAKDLVADGPFFKTYEVKDNKLIVSFEHAEGGLFVGQVQTDSKQPAIVVKVEDGEQGLGLFFLVGEDRVWHQATAKIVGESIELTAPGVANPRGVSYATPGVGFQPNIYNNASLPLTPFAVYDNAFVIKALWPDDPPKVDGVELDPSEGGLLYEYRKMPLLSTQFRDHAVLQHGKPVVIWGSAVHDWGPAHHATLVKGRKESIELSFGEFKKTIEVKPGMKEWSVTLDPMEPTDQPRTLAARYYIDNELVHERVAQNVVVGDVWFIAAPDVKTDLPKLEPGKGIVRVMERKAKRDRFHLPSPYSVSVSTTPNNRFACEWLDADSGTLGGHLAHHIAQQAGVPVGVIFMQSNADKNSDNPPFKSWLPFDALALVPRYKEDYTKLGSAYPGSPSYNDNLRRYIADWKAYWSDYIPEMIESKRVPDGSAWGRYPLQTLADEQSEATQSYNVMVHSFRHTAVKGIVFIGTPEMSRELLFWDGPLLEASALASSWREHFDIDPFEEKFLLSMIMPVKLDKDVLLPAAYLDGQTNMQPYISDSIDGERLPVLGPAFEKVFGHAVKETYD